MTERMPRRPNNFARIYAGLAALALTVLAAARTLGAAHSLWNGLIRYWPVLIFLWVLAKAADGWMNRWTNGRAGPVFSNRETAVLALLIVGGAILTAAAYLSPAVGGIFGVEEVSVWDMIPPFPDASQTR